jgi:hypothetical protein
VTELYRTQILLKSDQHKALAALAKMEGRSLSDLTRDIIDQYLSLQKTLRQEEEMKALNRARKFRRSLTRQRKGKPLDLDLTELIREMREERVDKILKGGS